jgi:hypothetical protein
MSGVLRNATRSKSKAVVSFIIVICGILPLASSSIAVASGFPTLPIGVPSPQGPGGGVQIATGAVIGSDGWTYFTNAFASMGVSAGNSQTLPTHFIQGSLLPGGGCSYTLVGPPVPQGTQGFVVTTAVFPSQCVAEVAVGTTPSLSSVSPTGLLAAPLGSVTAFAKAFEEDPVTIAVTAAIANITAYDPYGTSITSPSGYGHWVEFPDGWSLLGSTTWTGNTGPSLVSYGAYSASYNPVFATAMYIAEPLLAPFLCGTSVSTTTTDYAVVSVTASGSISAVGTSTASGACTALLSPHISYGSGHE